MDSEIQDIGFIHQELGKVKRGTSKAEDEVTNQEVLKFNLIEQLFMMDLFHILAQIFSCLDGNGKCALALAFKSAIDERILSRLLDLRNPRYAVPFKLLSKYQPSYFDVLELKQNWVECKYKIDQCDVPQRHSFYRIVASLNNHYIAIENDYIRPISLSKIDPYVEGSVSVALYHREGQKLANQVTFPNYSGGFYFTFLSTKNILAYHSHTTCFLWDLDIFKMHVFHTPYRKQCQFFCDSNFGVFFNDLCNVPLTVYKIKKYQGAKFLRKEKKNFAGYPYLLEASLSHYCFAYYTRPEVLCEYDEQPGPSELKIELRSKDDFSVMRCFIAFDEMECWKRNFESFRLFLEVDKRGTEAECFFYSYTYYIDEFVIQPFSGCCLNVWSLENEKVVHNFKLGGSITPFCKKSHHAGLKIFMKWAAERFFLWDHEGKVAYWELTSELIGTWRKISNTVGGAAQESFPIAVLKPAVDLNFEIYFDWFEISWLHKREKEKLIRIITKSFLEKSRRCSLET